MDPQTHNVQHEGHPQDTQHAKRSGEGPTVTAPTPPPQDHPEQTSQAVQAQTPPHPTHTALLDSELDQVIVDADESQPIEQTATSVTTPNQNQTSRCRTAEHMAIDSPSALHPL